MTKCIGIIIKAIDAIGPDYFRFKTTYEPSGIVRERVFCYELYHQMRRLMNDDEPLKLNGEIDKRGHIDFKKKHRKNPDFVFHIPGKHEGNTLVVEVKGYITKEILKDFKTLKIFVNNYRYRAGIFVLYNHSIKELMDVYGQEIKSICESISDNHIFIICKKNPKTKCELMAITSGPQ